MANSLPEVKSRIQEIEDEINAAPYWGAYLSVLHEELLELRRKLFRLEAEEDSAK